MISQFSENYLHYNKLTNKLDLTEYYNNNEIVSRPFVISLNKDIKRYGETKKLLTNLQLDCIKFPAIYGSSLKKSHNEIYKIFNKLNTGEIGCACSHMVIYYIASQHSNQDAYTLIFEDDIMLNNPLNSEQLQNKMYDAISNDPDIIYLGKCFEYCDQMEKLNDTLYYGYQPVCFHAYIIKNSYCTYLINYINTLTTINKPIDTLITSLTLPKKVLVFHPSLFIQNAEHVSNLRGTVAQRHNTKECKVGTSIELFTSGNNDLMKFVKSFVPNNEISLLSYYNDISESYMHPFIISLEKDKHKYHNTKKILDQLTFEPVKFDAIYGKDYEHTEIFSFFKDLNSNEIGCFLSHLSVIYMISKHPNKDGYSMIFEDDILLNPDIDYHTILDKIKLAMTYNTNLIYLGKCLEQCFLMKPIWGHNEIFYGTYPLCLHAYMIKNSFAKQIIDYVKGQNVLELAIDKILPKVSEMDNDIIVFHPSLFKQNILYDSNLRTKFYQQFNVMECHAVETIIKILIMITLLLIIVYAIYSRKI